MPLLKGQDIICISTSDWKYPFGSRQQIMQRLSKYNRVLFVESQISVLHVFKYPSLFLNKLKVFFRGMRNIKQSNGILYIYSPPPIFLPFDNYFVLINTINQIILLSFLRWIIRDIKFKPSIFWIFHPRNNPLCGAFGKKISIYHCIDEYSVEKSSNKRKRVLTNLEKKTVKKADIVFTCTEKLYEGKRYLHENVHLLRGGVDIDNFELVTQKEGDCRIPSDIEIIKPPRIGFVGTVDDRIDINLIYNIASQRPEWSIVFVGANRLNWRADRLLNRLNNIHFLGVKTQKELPYYLMAMDICIIPYLVNEFTRCIFPLKFLEYLAAGKPVISTPLPELESFKRVITIANDKNEFINSIEYILANEYKNYLEGLSIAKSNSWDIKTEELSKIIFIEMRKIEQPPGPFY